MNINELVTVEYLNNALNELKQLITTISTPQPTELIPSKYIPKILGVSQKTWDNYRKNRVIEYVQYGDKIWVTRDAIDKFIEANKVKRGY